MKSTIAATIPLSFLVCILTSTSALSINEIHCKSKIPNRIPQSVLPVAFDEGNISQDNNEAGNSRRSFLVTAAATLTFTISNPGVSIATYGEDAKILMPDIVQNMADRANKQCLSESLGTRECLVYRDEENQLYKGSDTKLLFEKLESSIESFKDVSAYIESKQWNKVQGVLTGPLGTLSSTMNEIVKIVDENTRNKCKPLSVDIRKDLYAINLAADRKNGKDALLAYEKAKVELENFVTLVSSS